VEYCRGKEKTISEREIPLFLERERWGETLKSEVGTLI
jgi:hypothetical protein